ncbi:MULTISPECIES: hypothetical protein [Kitasatospora]|uniref:Uncharacterized protein n=1 Tax=Kitasatospora setae (strain ATCC 33774 / DSM 43861 / JCM 3304 / KCC A-0304 / NBRC 14216 / KM-6054) TaxID=452652 RepID=E4NJS1_KITSK|nr:MULTISPECIES: hypothetical protein [Kitasatospora]BAJ33219.1 hypothetical protein KSE_74640 [Kitasatospora setae KM-6054]
MFTAVLYAASRVVRRPAARRRLAASGMVSDAHWALARQVWQASWLYRGCRAVFLPAGALRPGSPTSRAPSFEHVRAWLAGAEPAEGGSAGRKPAAGAG